MLRGNRAGFGAVGGSDDDNDNDDVDAAIAAGAAAGSVLDLACGAACYAYGLQDALMRKTKLIEVHMHTTVRVDRGPEGRR